MQGLLQMLEENNDEFCAALNADLNKPRQESITMETDYTCNQIRTALL